MQGWSTFLLAQTLGLHPGAARKEQAEVPAKCHGSDVLEPSRGADGRGRTPQLLRRPLGVGERTCHSIEVTFGGKESTMGNYIRSYVTLASSSLWGEDSMKLWNFLEQTGGLLGEK